MPKKIYVGNLSFEMTEQELFDLFAAHGPVISADVISDKYTGRSRGFGFVEMENPEDADKAIAAVNGSEVLGRQLKVNEANPRRDRGEDR